MPDYLSLDLISRQNIAYNSGNLFSGLQYVFIIIRPEYFPLLSTKKKINNKFLLCTQKINYTLKILFRTTFFHFSSKKVC